MSHGIYRIVGFQKVAPFTLEVRFDDGTSQVIGFQPVLAGELFGPLASPEVFDAVRLDAESGTMVWPNDAGFDPATLHDWPEDGPALAVLARSWESVRV